jgi:hypothetical protein
MSKAAELAKWGEVSTNGQVSGRRNIVTNGAMNVAQRSASVTGIGASAGYFTCDRWKIEVANTAGRFTQTQTADGPVGFANCLKLDCTTADTSVAAAEYLYIAQSFEGQDIQAINKGVTGAKQITLSFYVKANAAFTFVTEIQDYDNSRIISKSYATTTDWVRHEMIFDADADDGSSPFDDDNGASLAVNFWLHGGTNFTSGTLSTSWANVSNTNRYVEGSSFFSSTDNNFFITGVQMEVGSVATPFEHRSFGEELALCQRYFEKMTGAVNVVYASGSATFANQPRTVLFFKRRKRAVPTFTAAAAGNFRMQFAGANNTIGTAVTTASLGLDSAYLNATGVTISVNIPCNLISFGDDSFLTFDSEL